MENQTDKNMLKILSETSGNIVATQVSGNITKTDYDTIIPLLEKTITEHGKVKWYFEMDENHKWDLAALGQDLKFDWQHGKEVSKIAIAGAGMLEEQLTKLLIPLIGGPVRFFKSAERDKGLDWIRQ